MSDAELRDFIENGDICATPKCYYKPATGIILCVQCHNGSPEKASADLIFAKRLRERDGAKQ